MATGALSKVSRGKAGPALPVHVKQDLVVQRLIQAEEALVFAAGIDQVRLVMDVAAAQEVFAKRQGLGEDVIGYAHALKYHALEKLAQLIESLVKATGGTHGGRPTKLGSKRIPSSMAPPTLDELGVDKKTANIGRQLLKLPPKTREAIAQRETTIATARREKKRTENKAHLEAIEIKEVKALQGVYDVIVVDPPWPMVKIERDERPDQVDFDYPRMNEEELQTLTLPCADTCHVWVWTTQRFLPMAFRLLDVWRLKYVCTFVWHKAGGFQPIGLPQYNCEFALYARRGSPQFSDTKAFPTCFQGKRGQHSEKPDDFYDMVRRVTAGRRVDMFNRRAIDGFDGWGKEAA